MRFANKILSVFFLFYLLLNCSLFAQTIVTPTGYQTDFEDAFERDSCWLLNAGPRGNKCANKWYWGKPGANDGEYGLFVSGDAGATMNYQSVGVSVIAYRKLKLNSGLYDFSFDWQAGGRTTDGLYVCWIPETDTETVARLASLTTNALQEWVPKYALYFGTDSLRRGQRTWNSIADTIRSDGQQSYYLVFVWNNSGSLPYQPAVSIDNILIMEHGRCSRPSGLTVATKGDEAVLTWRGAADAYDVRCINNKTGEKIEFFDVTTTSQVITGLSEGMCTYYVRSKCGGVIGAWASTSKFLYYPAVRCIDYMSLTKNNCFTSSKAENYIFKSGAVDFGYQTNESRHTLHWNPLEVDPRTNGKLKTVPDGELASVRLGNWQVNAEAERIEYNYYVDTLTSAILELNYAVVLEDPDHDSLSQPRFTMEILTQKELSIDEFGCGEAFFSAGYNTSKEEGWHQMDNGWWKEWTKVSINLSKFHGQSLKIRLTTYDCTQTGHYGYAYFTLGCSDGKIKGLTCGDADSTLFKAPDGFKYRWYLPDDSANVISTEQTFSRPANDTLTYFLDVIQPTNDNCFYTLEASMVGRWPRAKAAYTHEVKDCKNVVAFDNQSYIKRINQVSKDSTSTSEKCESFVWDFGDGTTSTEENPIHIYPDESRTYTVKLYAGIAGGKCMDDTTFTVVLPQVGEMVDTTNAVICNGEYYLFNDDPKRPIYTTGIYSDTIVNEYGCNTIRVLNLTVLNRPQDTYTYDTICSHEEYYFNGELIAKSGIYRDTLKSANGCDSVSILEILVNESLFVDFDSTVWVCEDDENLIVPYTLLSGNFISCDVDMKLMASNKSYVSISNVIPQSDALVIPMADSIIPGIYNLNLTFGKTSCGLESVVLPIQVYYSKEILAQRWNDVLAVKNEKYNHLWNDNDTSGYQFIAFQWYKNGQPIEGATSSILYEPEGFDLDAEYYVLLTRLSDNVTIRSCVADLQDLSAKDEGVVVFESNKVLSVVASRSAEMRIWTSTGILTRSVDVHEGENVVYTTGLSGVYILDFLFEDGGRDIKQVVFE